MAGATMNMEKATKKSKELKRKSGENVTKTEKKRKSKGSKRGSKASKGDSTSKSLRGSISERPSLSPENEPRLSIQSGSNERKSKGSISKKRRKSSKKKDSMPKERKQSIKAKSERSSSQEHRGSVSHHRKSKKSVSYAKEIVLSEEEAKKVEKQTSLLYRKKHIIQEAFEPCYVCQKPSPFYKGGFFCENCQNTFWTFVKENKNSLHCAENGKCPPSNKCNFCLAETFYSIGIKATDVQDFRHVSRGFPHFYESSKVEPMNKDELAFCKHFNNTLKCVFDWLWKQGDLLKMTPKDREALLKTNVGRARMIWLVADVIPRHDVIKTGDGYIIFEAFTSEAVRQAVIDLHHLAIYFRSISITPQHMYFLKLLAVFQIGNIEDCPFCVKPVSNCHCDEKRFERVDEIKLIVETYHQMLKEMHIADIDIQRITEFFDLMYCSNSNMSKENGIEDTNLCFEKWAEANSQWKEHMDDMVPSLLNDYSVERLSLCNFLNAKCIAALNCAKEYLAPHLTSRDQKVLLCKNFVLFLLAWICWNATEEDLSPKIVNLNDEIVFSFYTNIKSIQEQIQEDLLQYFKYPDFIILFITQNFSGESINLLDTDVSHLYQLARSSTMQTIELKLKKDIPERAKQIESIKNIEKYFDAIVETIENTANNMDLSYKTMPLFLNFKLWLTDP